MGAPTPTFIPEPFANGASGGNVNFPIPDAPPSSPANAASWNQGFPAVTMEPEVSGGKPPLGQDFNGILLTLSQSTYALQAGQLYGFNASFVGTISGYALGAQLAMADGTGFWFNGIANNMANPDDPAAFGAGWVASFCYGITDVSALTGGTHTLLASQWKRPVLRFSGTLTSNCVIEIPNGFVGEWLVINNTSGAFTLTVKTLSGTGVAIAQGGPSQPTPIWTDMVNVYEAVAPLSAPISVPAVASTLLERDNLGQGYVVRLNQSAGIENPTIGAVPVVSNSLDGFFRLCSLSNFLSQIFASPTLTGVPLAPTAAVGTSNNQIATTAFASGTVTSNSNGTAVKFPNGFIVQFGQTPNLGGGGSFAVTFPIPFTSQVVPITNSTGVPTQSNPSPVSLTGMTVHNTGGVSYWIAVGF